MEAQNTANMLTAWAMDIPFNVEAVLQIYWAKLYSLHYFCKPFAHLV